MKLTKKIILSATAFALSTAVFADDFDDFGSDYGESSEPKVELSGKVEVAGRVYVDHKAGDATDVDWDNFSERKTAVFPSGKLNVGFNNNYSDLELKLKFDKFSLDGYYWDILDEFTARAYMGNWQFEAGKMRVVWGKGDKNHVLDNFNANDYTDYIIPDYIDRRIAEPMFRLVYSTPSNFKIEGIYTPMMTADRLASDGVWQPKAIKNLTSKVTELKIAELKEALGGDDGVGVMNVAKFTADDLYPDTYKLKYGQAGLRTTFTLGPVDLGLSYYYGHNKQPSANLENIINATAAGEMKAKANASGITLADAIFDSYTASDPELEYDQVQTFGIEGAFIAFGRLNSRFEAAYNLTKDIAGDDPWVHNNSVAWLGGFDIDLPISNLNINIQETGKYILNNDKIGDEEFAPLIGKLTGTPYKQYESQFKYSYKEYDVDYDSVAYTNNKLIVAITDSYNHEKIKLDLKGIWGIERGDLIILPTVTFNMRDDFNLNLSGMYIWCNSSDSEFDGWQHNSFAQIGVTYQF